MDLMDTQTLPQAGTYVLNPAQTTVGCHCKAMFGTMTVHGTFHLISGQFTIAPDVTRSTVSARIAADTYDSHLARRDSDVKSPNLLDVRKYPEISFEGSGVRQDGNEWVVTGEITAHGTTRPADLRIRSVSVDGKQVKFEADTALDRTDFGITKMKGRVGRKVTVSIAATAVWMAED
jgi:polyisoprenoid-binding protein YceI